MSYRISHTAGSSIPSFCLSIKGRHDAPSLSRALMVKNLTWLSMFVLKSFCFLQRLAVDVSRISQLFFLCRLWLPVNVRKHLLRIIGHSICQNCIKDSYQLTADGNHRLFLLERIVRLVLCQDLVQVKMRNFSHFNPPEAQPQCVFFHTIVRIHLVTYSYNGYEFVSYCRKLPDIRKSSGMPACNREF